MWADLPLGAAALGAEGLVELAEERGEDEGAAAAPDQLLAEERDRPAATAPPSLAHLHPHARTHAIQTRGSEPTLTGEHKHTGVSESAAVAAGSERFA